MSLQLRARSFVLALSLVLTACGSFPAGGGSSEGSQETFVRVVNRVPLDMTIYVLTQGGGRERLGTANGLGTTRLRIPSRLVTAAVSLAFQADPVGSPRTQFSQEILVTPGDTVVLEIPPS